jgi:hypothetical protein
MRTNGNIEADEERRIQPLLRGASNVDKVIPIFVNTANGMLAVGRALASIAVDLRTISTGTARAISDTVVLKRHLKAITEREQVLQRDISKREQALRRELNAVKLQMSEQVSKKRRVGKPEKTKRKRRR